jgi:hypothetical protein
MNKNSFILRVQSLKELSFGNELIGEGYTLSVSAWEPDGETMIDQHVTEYFPELAEEFGLEEVEEGQMISDTDQTVEGFSMMLTMAGYAVQY